MLTDIRSQVGVTQKLFSELADQSIEELIAQHHKLNAELVILNQKVAEKL
ncbi:hypothetical protein [Liquorilactobacillus uvarum]|nr:hypothetical protein [Liquorilactobacillus uvarum]